MELTEEQSKQFLEFYRNLYGDTSKETWTGELPTISIEDEEKHEKLWRKEIRKILWGKIADKTYTYRQYWRQTWLDFTFQWLWLQYWPKVLPNKFEQNADTDAVAWQENVWNIQG